MPNVPGGPPGSSSVDAPGWNDVPFSETPDLVEAFPRAERDLAKAVRERAGERDGDVLVDRDGAVRANVDLDVARDERVGLGLGDACEAERGDHRRREREPTSRACHRVLRHPRRARRAGRSARQAV